MSTLHTTTLHQRRSYQYLNTSNSTSTMANNNNSRSSPSTSSILRSTELTSSVLLKSNPIHHSKIYKLKIPFLYTITPTFLLTILHYCLYPFLLCFNIRLQPYWVERYFIVVGDYLYRFQPRSTSGMGRDNMKMKGCPIPLQTMYVSSLSHLRSAVHVTSIPLFSHNNNISNNDNDNNGNSNHNSNGLSLYNDHRIDTIPIHPNCNGYFTMTSSTSHTTKTNYYATDTQLDTQTWINILHAARQESITQSMGHSKLKGVSREVEYVNRMGKRIYEQKGRIQDLIRRKEMEEVELTCLNGGIGGPRGYFG